ncbi:hypothetical protein M408DRAFT_233237 [Serendipita vermifera MAFF 305830]|uniref:Uncharacterized protein n=1 Tax=Serendipita vermifera MAFF 305830 TaxID=933852 RepID=A0A0C2WD46_SERVB|nr:hypothetical protein M408DRAFT_233237 [Serendipita vermifera MAFF 305830]
MIVLLFAYSIIQSAKIEAGPIPASIELGDVASCDGQNSQRTLAGIGWSCLSTIFLCTWVAVHPNVHFRPEKQNQRWFERWLWDPLREILTYELSLFIWALLVPEYILGWAVRQYVQAGVIKQQAPGWTRTHGHFMIMGGFHLFRLPAGAPFVESSESAGFVYPTGNHSRGDEVPVCPLKFEDIPVYVLKTVAPTKTELKDRGKSDALTKIIVLVQALWFVMQCTVRGVQKLPLTELEVVTLAYATLNFFIYVFWWDKPQNAECPIRVYKTSTAIHEESGKEVKQWEKRLPVSWMDKTIEYTNGAQDDYVNLSKENSIPMFWSGKPSGYLLYSAGFGPSILGSAFGAIHCIAWLSEFPTRSELVLWRIYCIAMIKVPFVFAVVCAVVVVDIRTRKRYKGFFVAVSMICLVLIILSAWLYVASRVVTLVIAFTTLRSLPSTAFATVDWTSFIPHI